jgi:SOS-response transcriptional repressor LexA
MSLTKRQSEILNFLQSHIRDRGYAPSFEEIAEHFGFQSLATVHEHLTNLQPSRFCHPAARRPPRKFRCWARWPPAHRSSR